MKSKIFFLSFFAVLLIAACEKPTPPNGDPADPIDTTSLSYYLGGEWECFTIANPYVHEGVRDTVLITRIFHSSENKFYQTVVRLDTTLAHRSHLQYGGTSGWNDYELKGDTMYLRWPDGSFRFDKSGFSYVTYQHSPDTMVMSYRGGLPANIIRSYKFNRKNH